MYYKAVIFDLDGTLLDTLDDLADAANHTLKQLGFPEHPVDAYRYFVGSGMHTLVERILPEDERTTQTLGTAIEIFKTQYSRNWYAKTGPYKGVSDMLDGLKECGATLCILSNKPHDFTTLCVEKLLPRWSFFKVLGQRPGVPKKPDARGALEIVEQLGMEKQQVLYVGDTSIDMQTAANAGLDSAGVLWGFRTREELQQAGAKYLVASPEELVPLVTLDK
ncbi:HAD family hydrolase [Desulfogranum japonicum]|uniref:HAD family hydrolase n=1 Tax=Desulfogranum japonicum TaxID=231447 RepID=UPI0004224384|nr:HAD family hydrolase [Desulfogranum japonicum]